jgi:hypothetical protein
MVTPIVYSTIDIDDVLTDSIASTHIRTVVVTPFLRLPTTFFGVDFSLRYVMLGPWFGDDPA